MAIKVHEQSTFPLDYHFRGARSTMRPLFDEMILKLEKEMDFKLKIGKAYVGLIHTLVFAALHIQTKKIIVEFVLRKEISHERIFKTKHFQKQRWAYYVEVDTPALFDKQLVGWIKESYE